MFALKGGTAINLFYRDLPRLSVDIDLTYLPIEDRPTSLAKIDATLDTILADIVKTMPEAQVQRTAGGGHNDTRIRRHVLQPPTFQHALIRPRSAVSF